MSSLQADGFDTVTKLHKTLNFGVRVQFECMLV